jgi:hypothetical protein
MLHLGRVDPHSPHDVLKGIAGLNRHLDP